MQGSDGVISGTIPAKMSDFKVEPPSPPAIPTKDEIPVRVEMSWRPGPLGHNSSRSPCFIHSFAT